MVLFGGVTASNVVKGGIFILDIPTMTWSQGTAAVLANWRRGMACAAADDYFVAWGGKSPTWNDKGLCIRKDNVKWSKRTLTFFFVTNVVIQVTIMEP